MARKNVSFQPAKIDLIVNKCEIRVTYGVFDPMDILVMKDLSFFQFDMKGWMQGDFVRGKIDYGEILGVGMAGGLGGETGEIGEIEEEGWDWEDGEIGRMGSGRMGKKGWLVECKLPLATARGLCI